jgi:RNA polymerase sigma-70 factor (ECF subfamily)
LGQEQQFILEDEEAFNNLYVEYKPIIYKFVLSFTKNSVLSEDIIQDVFVSVWLARKKIDPNKPISSYLFTCARNKVYDFFKMMSKDRKALEENWENYIESRNITEEYLDAIELDALVKSAIEKLSAKKRAIFELSKYKGMTHEQIAEELGISKNTVKNHMVETLKYLKESIRYEDIALYVVFVLSVFQCFMCAL